MGLFVYTQKGSIISTVDLPTTEIIEPQKPTDLMSQWVYYLSESKSYFKKVVIRLICTAM